MCDYDTAAAARYREQLETWAIRRNWTVTNLRITKVISMEKAI